MKHYRIKFSNGFETFMQCSEGFDVGTEILKWNDPELTLETIEECDQFTATDFMDVVSQPDEAAMRAKLAQKRPVKVDVKAQWQAIEDEKRRGGDGS